MFRAGGRPVIEQSQGGLHRQNSSRRQLQIAESISAIPNAQLPLQGTNLINSARRRVNSNSGTHATAASTDQSRRS